MTRINLIPPIELTDNHLIAEIKEINQLAGSFRKSLNSKYGIKQIPPKFTLNKGHVTFFYDKGMYLHKRFESLKQEALNREFKVIANFQNEWIHTPQYYNDWNPTEDSIRIIKERISTKLQLKPHIYRYYKNPIKNLDL